MNVSSRLATWQVVAAGLLIMLGFGSPALQARQQGCQQGQKECPAPVLQKPTVSAPCCPAPVVREKPAAPPAPTCCPVDPKEVRRAEKAAEHAQHEAAEACKRQQKAAAEAQRKIDEAYAQGNHEIEEATAKLNERNSEWAEENAKLNSLRGSSESAAEATSQQKSESAADATPQQKSEFGVIQSVPHQLESIPHKIGQLFHLY